MALKSWRFRTVCLAGVLAAGAARADNGDDIVVTAARMPQPLAQVGSSLSVIDAQTIERRQYRFALDAVNSLPGLSFNQNGAFGGAAGVSLRGVKSEQTLVMIDGFVVNDPSAPSAGFDFARLDLEDVARIEVLRGPQSTLYGSDAMGGVVNLITKAPQSGLSAHAYAEGGSFGTYRGGGTLNAGFDRASVRLSVTGVHSDGISKADKHNGNTENDPYRAVTESGTGRVTLSDNVFVDAFVRNTDSRTAFDTIDFVTGFPVDGDERTDANELLAAGRVHVDAFGQRFRNVVSYSHAKITRDNFTNGLPSFSAEGVRDAVEYQGTVKATQKIDVVFGAKHELTKLRTDFDRNDVNIDSVYGLVQVVPITGLSLSAGTRYDHHETFGGKVTGRFTGAYTLAATGTTLRASWGQGFKAPTPFQLTYFCCGAATPNLALEPETNEGWDAGLEQHFLDNKLMLKATYFYQQTANLIDFSFLQGGYVNIESARTKGVEIEADAKLAAWLDVGGSFTFTEALDRTTGLRLIRVPRGQAKGFVTLTTTERFDLTISTLYTGAEQDARGPLAPWTRVDLALGFKLNDHVSLFGRIENLFDVRYQEALGYGTPGLSAYAGVKLRS